ncbi:MAG: methyl-accepting chemotaxis protein [Acidiferrobacterales bacterium]
MDFKRTNSIGFRFALVSATTVIILVAVLFAAYIQNDHKTVIDGEVKKARSIVLMAESVRQNMEKKWELGIFTPEIVRQMEYTSAEDRKQKMLAVVPVVAAWESAKAKAKEGGFEFRTPRQNARNPKNNPDPVEAEVLDYFKRDPSAAEKYVIDDKMNAVRYFRPVRLGKVCLNCHGDPATSFAKWRRDDGRDITGFKMDNKHVGDLHGAFEIISPLDKADAALAGSLRNALAIVVPILIAAILITIYFVRRMVTKPLDEAVQVCSNIANGDLSVDIDATRKDEVGMLLTSLKNMTGHLRNIVGQVLENTESISHSSQEIAAGNTSLSQRTEEQASSLEETASSMEEMTGTVKQNADSAAEARQLADANRKRASNGAEVVTRTVKAMGEINDSSNRIADIITTIDGIAFQTNLLALNAAVEAARAGEQGRGFAVVASEVRSLAQRSAEAAKEIKNLIEDSVGKVNVGTELVDESGKTLEEIIEGTQKVADIVAEIAAASIEQASGIDQVNNAITQMDNMTQDNAALVEEAAASSRAMQEQANELRELMSFFKLDISDRLGSDRSRGNGKTHQQIRLSDRNTSQPVKSRQEGFVRPKPEDSTEWEQF